jgi:hypothetical protein
LPELQSGGHPLPNQLRDLLFVLAITARVQALSDAASVPPGGTPVHQPPFEQNGRLLGFIQQELAAQLAVLRHRSPPSSRRLHGRLRRQVQAFLRRSNNIDVLIASLPFFVSPASWKPAARGTLTLGPRLQI